MQLATSVILCYRINRPHIHLFLHMVSQPRGHVLTASWISAFSNFVSFLRLRLENVTFFPHVF